MCVWESFLLSSSLGVRPPRSIAKSIIIYPFTVPWCRFVQYWWELTNKKSAKLIMRAPDVGLTVVLVTVYPCIRAELDPVISWNSPFTHCKDIITKIRNKYSQKRNCAATVLIFTFMCRWAIYKILGSVCLFCSRKICGPILGIHKSLTDTWMGKLGLRPRNSFSGN